MSPEEKQELDRGFIKVQQRLFREFRKNPDLNAILFLIGVRELGVIQDEFTKEEKQDLMHIAICRLLSEEGYYQLEGHDQDGWPHWQATKALPDLSLDDQENLLKKRIILYFDCL